jgi:hypothetical protein
MKTVMHLLAGAITLALASPLALAGDSGKVRVAFTKCNPSPEPGYLFSMTGPVTGDVVGHVTAKIVAAIPTADGTQTYLEADYFVTANAPGDSFVASVAGRLDNATGAAVLNGYVSGSIPNEDGTSYEKWRGSAVRDEFQNFAGAGGVPCSGGTLVLTPRWN